MTLAYDCGELLGSIVPALLEENEEQARRIDALMAFAARCQRAHATPGCEREPVKMAYMDLLASRIERTADAREEQARRIEGLELERDGLKLSNGLQHAAIHDANDERIRQNQRIERLERVLADVGALSICPKCYPPDCYESACPHAEAALRGGG
jgi:hypothetical protein